MRDDDKVRYGMWLCQGRPGGREGESGPNTDKLGARSDDNGHDNYA